ncbi:hypothetical protein H6F75_09810 [Nodosilinea sp. FACHB-131]|nr:hypothetical protein [Nodosilinea sp. FACHB-131]
MLAHELTHVLQQTEESAGYPSSSTIPMGSILR